MLAGKNDPLDFVLLVLRSGYCFFLGKSIINHKTLKRYQFAVWKRNKAFLKIWSLSTPGNSTTVLLLLWEWCMCRSHIMFSDNEKSSCLLKFILILKSQDFEKFQFKFIFIVTVTGMMMWITHLNCCQIRELNQVFKFHTKLKSWL